MFGRRLGQNLTNANGQHTSTSLAARGRPTLRPISRMPDGQRTGHTSWVSSKKPLPKPSCEPKPSPEIFSDTHYKRTKQIDNIWDNEIDEFDCSVSYF